TDFLRLLLYICAATFPLFFVVFSTLSLLFYSKAIPPETLVPIIHYFGLIDHFRGNFSPFETDKFLKQIIGYQFGIFNRYRIRSLRPIFTEIIRVFFFDLQIIKTQISIDKPSILNEPSDCRFSISTNVKSHPFIAAWKFQIFVSMQIFYFYFINYISHHRFGIRLARFTDLRYEFKTFTIQFIKFYIKISHSAKWHSECCSGETKNRNQPPKR